MRKGKTTAAGGEKPGSDEEAEVRGREQKGAWAGFCRFAPCGGRRAFGRSPVRRGRYALLHERAKTAHFSD